MQERHLFEYAVIRVMPRVEREEFINVGVIIYCAKKKYLAAAFHLPKSKLKAIDDQLELPSIAANLTALLTICKGGKAAGPIGLLEMAERFRWLTATRSTIVQCSKVHPGFCIDPAQSLIELMDELVL